MPRWPLLLLTLSLALPSCSQPQEDPATQPTTQLADSQPAEPQTQPAPEPSTQPAIPSSVAILGQQKERKILELAPGTTFESVKDQFDDPFLSDSLFFQIRCPGTDNLYFLQFGPDSTEQHLLLYALFWQPKDAYITLPIVIWPKSKAGLTFPEADLFTLPPPTLTTQPATTQPTQPPPTPGT